jgi:carbonic anhydrase
MLLVVSLLVAGCAHTAPPSTAGTPHAEPGGGAHGTEALLLSCMDYRLTDEVERYMSGRGLRDQYDQVILAGAALGATIDQRPAWNTTFWEHLDVAIQLHDIHKVIVLDHRDCGAFRAFLAEDFAKDREKETAIHTETLRTLAKQIHEKRPEMKVELLLMDLDGKVEAVSETP